MSLYILLAIVALTLFTLVLALLALQKRKKRPVTYFSAFSLYFLLASIFYWQQYHTEWTVDPHWLNYYKNFRGPSITAAQAASTVDHPEVITLAEQTRQARQRMQELQAVAKGKISGENFDTFQLLLTQGRLTTSDLLPLYQQGGLTEAQLLKFLDQGLLSVEQWQELEEQIKEAAAKKATPAPPAPAPVNQKPVAPVAQLQARQPGTTGAETVALALASQAKQLSRAQLDQLVLAQLKTVPDAQIQALLPDLTPDTGREQLTVIIVNKLVGWNRNELAARFLYEFYRLPEAEQKLLLQKPLTTLPPQQQIQALSKPLALLVSDTLAGLQRLLAAN
ncbi:hypothetical protein [Carboxydocella sp. ULO1]|uniref:hypothetical protein n=1 Tax=Carboxydocella sp. ULO1 TaxID=1926599 RepID=UPI0009ACBA0F|nr:hypothetical protein [Carboxydocella sp. ULO1]GAW28900.1 hypothetical protein ULO1_14700 [Carboxydocella sp. ULO1]